MTSRQLINTGIVSENDFKEFCEVYDTKEGMFYSEPDRRVLNGFYGKVKKQLGIYENWAVIKFEGVEVLDEDDPVLYPILLLDCPIVITTSIMDNLNLN